MKERSNVRMKYLIMMTCTDSSTEPYSIQPPLQTTIQVRRPNPTKGTDPHHSQRTERDSERGEKVIWGSQDERRPNPTKGTRPPLPTDERDSERGEGDLDELERGTGSQGWLEID